MRRVPRKRTRASTLPLTAMGTVVFDDYQQQPEQTETALRERIRSLSKDFANSRQSAVCDHKIRLSFDSHTTFDPCH
jgi:hypothetical protein